MAVLLNRNDATTRPLNQKRLVGGFTLLELITVIAVIGILSSIVMVSLGSAREKARDGRRIAEVKNLQLALDFYFEVNGRYPTPSEFGDNGTEEPLVGKYISTMPTDPKTGNNYRYSSPGAAPFDYHLGASLETDHEELENDTDFDSSAAVPPWTSVFNGVTGNCFGPTGTPPPDMCYDVKAQ